MTDLIVTFSTVSIPTGSSATVYVFEDTTGDGTANNSNSTQLSDGTTQYSLSGFDASSGNDVWIRIEQSLSDITVTSSAVEPASVEPAAVTYNRTSKLYGSGEVTDSRTVSSTRSSQLYGTGEVTDSRTLSSVRISELYGSGNVTDNRTISSTRTSELYAVGQTIGSRDVKREVSIMTAQEQWDNYGISFYEGTNTYKLVTALLGYERNTNFTRLEKNHYVSEATTNALDRIGQLVQCYRKDGESDEKYASRIKAFGVASRSDGTFGDVIDLVKIILGISYEDISITYSGAEAIITIPVNSLNNTELTDSEFVNVVEKSVFAGHRIVINKAGSDPFTLKTAGDPDDASLGLSSETVEGGGLVEQI